MNNINLNVFNSYIQISYKLDNGDSNVLFITDVTHITYDKSYHKTPVFLFTISGATFISDIKEKSSYPPHIITITLQEFQSESFFHILVDQYILQLGKQNALFFPKTSPAWSSEQLRIRLSEIQQKQYVCNYQGGWQMIDHTNSCNYIGTINRHMRTLAEKNPAEFSTLIKPANLLPLNSSLINTCIGIANAFNQISDRDTRIFLFLYYHYCFTASLFGNVQSEKILCIDTVDPILRSTIISRFFPVTVCENIYASESKREFLAAYDNTNDIPFVIEELPCIRNSTVGKLESIVNKIALLQRTPMFSTIPRSIPIIEDNFAVPIVFTEQLHTEASLYHIFFDLESFYSLQLSTPLSSTILQEYLNHFVTYFPPAFQDACNRSRTYGWSNNIFIIFYTLYTTWEHVCSSLSIDNPLRIHDTPNSIDACSTTELLYRFLPKISTVKTATPQLFLDTLKKLADNRTIPIYKRLGTSVNECIPVHYFNNPTFPFILENTDSDNNTVWGINITAIQTVLKNLPGQNHSTEVLRMLSDNGILETSNIHSASYQKRYTVYCNSNGEVVKYENIALYCILFPIKEKEIDPTQAPPYIEPNTLHFELGRDMEYSSNVYWNFEDENIPNKHMLLTGQSGCGKSFFLSKLIKQASEQKLTTVVIHLQGDLPSADNPIVIDMADDKPGIDLDNKELYNGETVFSLLQKTYKINDIHKLMIQGVYDTYARSYHDKHSLFTFAKEFYQYKLEYDVSHSNTGKPMKVAYPVQRMLGDIVENHFFSKDSLRWDRYHYKTVILDFSKCADSPVILSQLTTIFLTDLYRWQKNLWQTQANNEHTNENHLILVIDEFQHLVTNKNSIINEILREGRKFGVSFWMASQTVSSENGSLFNECVKHASIRVFFNSGKEGNKKIANLLGYSQNQKTRYFKILDETLTKGQFLLSCSSYPIIPVDGYTTTSEEYSQVRKHTCSTTSTIRDIYSDSSINNSNALPPESSLHSFQKQESKTFNV